MTPEQFAILQSQYVMLSMYATALGSGIVTLSIELSFPLSSVIRYELVETEKDGEPTGKTEPVIFMPNCPEIALTEKQNEVFKQQWNHKAKVDLYLKNLGQQLAGSMFPELAVPGTAPLQILPGTPA